MDEGFVVIEVANSHSQDDFKYNLEHNVVPFNIMIQHSLVFSKP